MRRRDFITLFGGVAAVWPLGALAQQPDRKRRIGVLMNLAENQEAQARITAFRQALEQFSWTDRRNVQIEIRWAGGILTAIAISRRNWWRWYRTSSWPLVRRL
ncbi:MAG: hypothetical protein WA756_05255 [Pseudolabrys sp.]